MEKRNCSVCGTENARKVNKMRTFQTTLETVWTCSDCETAGNVNLRSVRGHLCYVTRENTPKRLVTAGCFDYADGGASKVTWEALEAMGTTSTLEGTWKRAEMALKGFMSSYAGFYSKARETARKAFYGALEDVQRGITGAREALDGIAERLTVWGTSTDRKNVTE